MDDLSEEVARIVALNGGTIVGKTRLQKVFYLLEQARLVESIDFDYHHFGPFSSDLAQAVDDAKAVGLLEEDRRLGRHSVPYSIFSLGNYTPPSEVDQSSEVVSALEKMQGYSAIELELAATALYLRENGHRGSFLEELKIRKPSKATEERVKRSLALIDALGLA